MKAFEDSFSSDCLVNSSEQRNVRPESPLNRLWLGRYDARRICSLDDVAFSEPEPNNLSGTIRPEQHPEYKLSEMPMAAEAQMTLPPRDQRTTNQILRSQGAAGRPSPCLASEELWQERRPTVDKPGTPWRKSSKSTGHLGAALTSARAVRGLRGLPTTSTVHI